MATGTSHSGMPAPTKPLSSSGFINAGNAGSVSAATSEARPATTMPLRPLRKYGTTREIRCNTVAMDGRPSRPRCDRLTRQLTIIPAAPAYNACPEAAAACGTSAAEANPQHFMVIPPETQQGPSRRRWLAGALAAGALHGVARAQFRVEISGVGATQLPIAIDQVPRRRQVRPVDLGASCAPTSSAAACSASSTPRGDFDETSRPNYDRVARPRRRRAGGRLGDAPGRRPLRRALQAVGRGQGRRARRPEHTPC